MDILTNLSVFVNNSSHKSFGAKRSGTVISKCNPFFLTAAARNPGKRRRIPEAGDDAPAYGILCSAQMIKQAGLSGLGGKAVHQGLHLVLGGCPVGLLQ